MECYLDNSATTRCSSRAAELMMKLLREDYGNPSSLHGKGFAAEKYVTAARRLIAETLKASEKEVIFTSGGTESNNMAILGGLDANRRRGKHIITTSIEHSSVGAVISELENRGYEVTRLSSDACGRISLEELRAALRPDTVLVSMMQVNNEIGAVEPVQEAGEIIKGYSREILFHVDGVQGYGKQIFYPGRTKVDLYSVSGHKLCGPKGSGFLYVRERTKIHPILLGGGQQKGFRSGTENVPAIAGLGEAVRELFSGEEAFSDRLDRLYELKAYFVRQLMDIEGVSVNGIPGIVEPERAAKDDWTPEKAYANSKATAGRTPEHTSVYDAGKADRVPEQTSADDAGKFAFEESIRETAPHIVSISVRDVRAEVLLHALEEHEIYVSAGSACSSNKPAVSATLKAIGLDPKLLDSTVRFSFSMETTREQLDYTLDVLGQLIPRLRRFTRR